MMEATSEEKGWKIYLLIHIGPEVTRGLEVMYRVVEATSEEEGWKSYLLIHIGPEVARGYVQGGGGHQ